MHTFGVEYTNSQGGGDCGNILTTERSNFTPCYKSKHTFRVYTDAECEQLAPNRTLNVRLWLDCRWGARFTKYGEQSG